jgi:PAS domain S-box-containing protein
VRDTLAYCLTFANDPHDFDINMIQLDQLMAGQLSYCRNKRDQGLEQRRQQEEKIQPPPQYEHIDTLPLPQQWEEAIRYQTSRAIVITENIRPFRIVHVNTAWENLCGYNKKEAYGQSLGSLLHGPETDVGTITSMLFPLLHMTNHATIESGAVVTNYTKHGRRFRNRVRIGPLFGSNNNEHDLDNNSIGNFARSTTTTNKNATNHYHHIQQQQPRYFVGVLQEIHDGL